MDSLSRDGIIELIKVQMMMMIVTMVTMIKMMMRRRRMVVKIMSMTRMNYL